MKRATLILLLALAATAAVQAQTRFLVTIENVGPVHPVLKSGVFDTPVGADAPGPLFPGEAYEFGFTAGPGMRLSLATMFVQSNDAFYAFAPDGLPLFGEDGSPIDGDVTDMLSLWDAGTEVDEEPGVGPNQAPRQPAPDTGADEDGVITEIGDGGMDDGFAYPANDAVLRVTVTNDGATGFTVRIENVSDAGTLATSQGSVAVPLSPGTWAVHPPATRFFEPGSAASEGIERIAEDGSAGASAGELDALTGLTVPLSPGAFAVHTTEAQLFEAGAAASEGIERIAEDGDPSAQTAALKDVGAVQRFGVFNTPAGVGAPAPIFPGDRYAFKVTAEPGDRLSLVTMFIQSNDLFYAFDAEGLALFDASGDPVDGDVTDALSLWDAGTEVDEEPGVGPNQAPRQPAPGTGADEDGVIVRIPDGGMDDGFEYPATAGIVRVTVTPIETVPFVVRIRNLSDGTTLPTSQGSVAVPLSPGAFAVHGPAVRFFEAGAAASEGIEGIAEDGNPAAMGAALKGASSVVQSGVFNTPAGAGAPAPIFPGEVYEFGFEAEPGDRLSLATMFVQSNDAFYAFAPEGLALFDGTTPRSGDLTDALDLWDAGTEVDEEPGVGPNQAPRQPAPDTGADEDGVIVRIPDGGMDDGFEYPARTAVIQVTLLPNTSVSVEPIGEAVPDGFQLHPNYPNPFNPSTEIRYDLAQAGPVRLAVYDVLGREVAVLVAAEQAAGSYRATWDGTDAAGRTVASGLYLYRLHAAGTAQTRRMVLLK